VTEADVGELAQPKNADILEEAGDFGSGLLRLLFSVLEAAVVACTMGSTGPRVRCGGGDFRDEVVMVLITVLRLPADSGNMVGKDWTSSYVDS
jgi:hypothetical protein